MRFTAAQTGGRVLVAVVVPDVLAFALPLALVAVDGVCDVAGVAGVDQRSAQPLVLGAKVVDLVTPRAS
jgi:hypothetical protein